LFDRNRTKDLFLSDIYALYPYYRPCSLNIKPIAEDILLSLCSQEEKNNFRSISFMHTTILFGSIIKKGIPMFVSVCEEKPCFYLELDPELQSALLHKSDISQLSSENFNKKIDINRSIHT
jgi:hypothetical protein